MNFIFQVVFLGMGLLVTASIVTTCIYLIRDSRLMYKQLTAPKPQVAKIPEYMEYEKCFKQLASHASIQFQRIYTTLVLPNLRDSHGRINRLAPTDKKYEEIVTTMVLQCLQLMPHYLKKSVYFYFNVIDDTKEDQLTPMIEYLNSAFKGKLDAHIVTIAERIESDRSGNADILLGEIKAGGSQIISGVDVSKIKSPDGSEMTISE